MSHQDTDQKSSANRVRKFTLVVFATFMLLASFSCSKSKPNPKPKQNGGGASEASDFLTLTRDALAATENMDSEKAGRLWDELFKAFPNDQSVALNRSLNRSLYVDELAAKALNSNLTDEERKSARSKLPDAISQARDGIAQFEEKSKDTITPKWQSSETDLQEATLLPAAMTKSIRRGVFDQLTKLLAGPLGKDPRSLILGGPLTQVIKEMEDPLDGLPADVLEQAAKTVGLLSQQHAENLFLALTAAQLNVAAKKQSAVEHVQRSSDLAKAIRPSLYQKTKPVGLTPEELVAELTSAIKSETWRDADLRMAQWFNVVNPEEIMKTDRRRVSPHPLDRLSFQTLRRLSVERIDKERINKSDLKVQFAVSSIGGSNVVAVETVDFDLDLDDDVVFATAEGKIELWKNDAGKFAKHSETESKIKPIGLFTVDLFEADASNPDRIKKPSDGKTPESRHNTFPGLVAYSNDGVELLAIDGRSTTPTTDTIKVVEKKTGLEDVKNVSDIAVGDLEGDGDLDLIVATKDAGLRLFINRGDRSFFEIEHQGTFKDKAAITDMQIADIDRDLDLDVITLHGDSGEVGIVENLLHLQFRERPIKEIGTVKGAASIQVGDFDGNVSWDIAITSKDSTKVVFSQTAEAGMWTPEPAKSIEQSLGLGHAVAIDIDNDSWQELISDGKAAQLGPWGVSSPVAVASLADVQQLVPTDIQSDGKLDFIGIQGGKAVAAKNTSKTDNHFVKVRFKGIADNAASSGRVNHYGIGSVLELRFGPHYRSQIVTRPATHFGLANYGKPGSVRVIMPNGLTQTIRQPAVDTLVEEQQSAKGSCPYLYAWDGEKFVFMTDCLWAAPLGLQVADGVVAKDRPWEYLKVDGSKVKPRGDHYDLRITEELWEIAYIEKVGLTAIDHPEDVQVWTNEKVGPASIAKQTIFAFRDSDIRKLQNAQSSRGEEVTETLMKRDGNYVQAFEQRLRQGLCPPHWIDLDFTDSARTIRDGQSVYLVLSGWIMPTDTSLNIQIDQNPNLPAPEFPSVWVPDADAEGGWRKAIPYAGFPGGKTKTIVIDVTDVILKDDPRLRVRTSAQIYWDDACLAVQSSPPPYKEHAAPLAGAELSYHGYSFRTKPDSKSPEYYDFQKPSVSPKWPPLRGPLTSYGKCLPLVKEWDDKMVVMGSGDQLHLKFAVPDQPIPDGWKRDFVLHCVGWDKDADLNTLTGQTTMPLPQKQMSQFPPTLADEANQQSVRSKNGRELWRHQSFRAFWQRDLQQNIEPKRFQSRAFGG